MIYGSRAMGSFREGSDIDITLKGHGLTSEDLGAFMQAIEELNLPYLFDISLYHQIDNDDLKDHIQRIGRIIYSQKIRS